MNKYKKCVIIIVCRMRQKMCLLYICIYIHTCKYMYSEAEGRIELSTSGSINLQVNNYITCVIHRCKDRHDGDWELGGGHAGLAHAGGRRSDRSLRNFSCPASVFSRSSNWFFSWERGWEEQCWWIRNTGGSMKWETGRWPWVTVTKWRCAYFQFFKILLLQHT